MVEQRDQAADLLEIALGMQRMRDVTLLVLLFYRSRPVNVSPLSSRWQTSVVPQARCRTTAPCRFSSAQKLRTLAAVTDIASADLPLWGSP